MTKDELAEIMDDEQVSNGVKDVIKWCSLECIKL